MLRSALAEDASAVAEVLVESRRAFLPFAPSPHAPANVQDWVATQLIPAGRVTVAVQEGRVVAVLAVSEDEDAGWIDQLYVRPGFVNQGIGSALLQLAHESIKRPIRLLTFQQNVGARRFYERHGYQAITFSDGQGNEEKCPDVLYELGA
jgi:GNAT superfamily N-acetyltransferase